VGKAIIFYRTADGKCPVKAFLDSLSAKVVQKVALNGLRLTEETICRGGQRDE